MIDYLTLILLIIRLLQTVYCLLISNSICPDRQSHKPEATLYGFALVYLLILFKFISLLKGGIFYKYFI
mgnify:CR=1 FL=1